ncbi:MAG: apolipoprotein N-acyltransferase, partial [Candidatus Binatia bacterium]
ALLGYGAWALRAQALRPAAAPLRAGIVQADIQHYAELATELGTYGAVQHILDVHFALSDELLAAGPLDLLVWPETVYPTTFGAPKSPEGAGFDRDIGTFASRRGVPLIFGAYDAEHGAEFNAAMFVGPGDGSEWRRAVYRKASLFPLTERVPAWLDTPAVRRRLPWLGTWQPGRSPRVVAQRLPGGRTLRVAPLICYDAVDPQLAIAAARQGAEVIVTLSNDAWFATGEGPHLHLVVAAFRSIETRLPQLRATNTGISAVISPTGEVLAAIGVDQRAALRAEVSPAPATPTLMLAWGDWFGRTALAGAALLAAAHALARSVRRRR